MELQFSLLWPIPSQEGTPVKPLRDRGAHREQGGTGTATVWNEAGAAAGPNAVRGRGLGSLAVIPWTWGPCVAVTGTCFSPCEFRGPGAGWSHPRVEQRARMAGSPAGPRRHG